MKLILFIIVLLTLISCDYTKKTDHFDADIIKKEVRLMLSDYHTDINNEGLTAEFKYLDNSSDFFWVPPGYTSALSYDSVRTILQQNAKSLRDVEFHWNTLQVFPLSNKIANYTGIVNGKMIDTAGVKLTMSIIESGTIIKRKDGWKLLNGQSAVLDIRE